MTEKEFFESFPFTEGEIVRVLTFGWGKVVSVAHDKIHVCVDDGDINEKRLMFDVHGKNSKGNRCVFHHFEHVSVDCRRPILCDSVGKPVFVGDVVFYEENGVVKDQEVKLEHLKDKPLKLPFYANRDELLSRIPKSYDRFLSEHIIHGKSESLNKSMGLTFGLPFEYDLSVEFVDCAWGQCDNELKIDQDEDEFLYLIANDPFTQKIILGSENEYCYVMTVYSDRKPVVFVLSHDNEYHWS